MADEYEPASPQLKLDIATYFILSSPTGEVDQVVSDVKKLVADESVLDDSALSKIMLKHNCEQMLYAKDPESDAKVLVSSYGKVADDEFLEPDSGRVLKYDHLSRKFLGITEKKQKLDAGINAYRTAISNQLKAYTNQNDGAESGYFRRGKCSSAVYGAANGEITVCISAKNINLAAFWSGAWRSLYVLNVSSKGKVEIKADIKINVHYFEEGNVQLHGKIEKTTQADVTADPEVTGKNIAKAIAELESDYHRNVEDMYVNMHKNTFKGMRRFLPITRQKMVWNPTATALASQVGGAGAARS
jgi:capping protein (actin filament) muscle Z-line, alpha